MIMAAPKLVAEPDWHSKVIVVSNDSPDILKVFRCVLQDAGFRHVYESQTNDGTLNLVERLAPDVVFTDMVKPEGTFAGEQLARVIRGTSFGRYVPMVLASAWPDIDLAWFELFDDFLTLPFRSEQLVAFTHDFLRERN